MKHWCWDCKAAYECFDPLNLCPCQDMGRDMWGDDEPPEGASIQCPECYDIEHGES